MLDPINNNPPSYNTIEKSPRHPSGNLKGKTVTLLENNEMNTTDITKVFATNTTDPLQRSEALKAGFQRDEEYIKEHQQTLPSLELKEP